ncbi:hypothetical protein ACIQYS_08085 [Psychrobacillus sp. NPDC096426]|uniref:hypothetical protein n=1 Tax=Psychrobacillus sp. NPDC096426 TaxID=3364491 RepID=UPI0037FE4496
MKKYLLFITSFTVLFFVLQIGSGMILTLFYTPDITSTGISVYSEVEFGNTSPIYLIGTIIIATIAFLLSQIFTFKKNATI